MKGREPCLCSCRLPQPRGAPPPPPRVRGDRGDPQPQADRRPHQRLRQTGAGDAGSRQRRHPGSGAVPAHDGGAVAVQ